MATQSKDDVSAPIAVLLLFLALAFGAASIDGGDGGDNGRAVAEDPCDGEPMNHVVASWPTRTGDVELRCGDRHEGWEHLRARGRLKGDRDNILDCIGRTLARAPDPTPEGPVANPQWVYRWRWGSAVVRSPLFGSVVVWVA